MRLIIAFNRRALAWLWREPVHDLEVLRAKDRRQELVGQIMATAHGSPAPNEFVAEAAKEVASLPPGDQRAAAWNQAHNLVVRAIMARRLLENP
jgi:hypothetical protein